MAIRLWVGPAEALALAARADLRMCQVKAGIRQVGAPGEGPNPAVLVEMPYLAELAILAELVARPMLAASVVAHRGATRALAGQTMVTATATWCRARDAANSVLCKTGTTPSRAADRIGPTTSKCRAGTTAHGPTG